MFKLFDANTGVYALNALHVLRDPTWIEQLTSVDDRRRGDGARSRTSARCSRRPTSPRAHAFLETKQATGKVLLHWS